MLAKKDKNVQKKHFYFMSPSFHHFGFHHWLADPLKFHTDIKLSVRSGLGDPVSVNLIYIYIYIYIYIIYIYIYIYIYLYVSLSVCLSVCVSVCVYIDYEKVSRYRMIRNSIVIVTREFWRFKSIHDFNGK